MRAYACAGFGPGEQVDVDAAATVGRRRRMPPGEGRQGDGARIFGPERAEKAANTPRIAPSAFEMTFASRQNGIVHPWE